jgi:hypothetical protein
MSAAHSITPSPPLPCAGSRYRPCPISCRPSVVTALSSAPTYRPETPQPPAFVAGCRGLIGPGDCSFAGSGNAPSPVSPRSPFVTNCVTSFNCISIERLRNQFRLLLRRFVIFLRMGGVQHRCGVLYLALQLRLSGRTASGSPPVPGICRAQPLYSTQPALLQMSQKVH